MSLVMPETNISLVDFYLRLCAQFYKKNYHNSKNTGAFIVFLTGETVVCNSFDFELV